MNNKVEAMGSLWASTAPYVEKAKEYERKKEEERRRKLFVNYVPVRDGEDIEKHDAYYENIEEVMDKMAEIAKILKGAGINPKLFPFKPETDKDGNIVGFVPKGKNEKEIKRDIEKYRDEIQKALDEGRLTQDEFQKLNDNLEDLMEENEIEEEEEMDLTISDEEILANVEQLKVHCFGNDMAFDKFSEKYDQQGLDGRKACLEKFNSEINQQLGISGSLAFSTNPNLKFENSFTKNGYMLTEEEVLKNGLDNTLYTMMEKSMIREKEIKNQQTISAQQKKKMHEKVMKEKMMREKQRKDSKNAAKTRQRMRDMFGNN